MLPTLEPHNLHLSEGLETFAAQDPNLRRLNRQTLRYRSPLLDRLPLSTPGIYSMVGGRQVGKSTFVKQLMEHLMRSLGVAPERIAYLTGEVLPNAVDFQQALDDLLPGSDGSHALTFLFVDEVTYIDGWDRVVKYLADIGRLDRTFLLLTGSDSVLVQDALKRLPGRRGLADHVDYEYHSLDFLEFCRLRRNIEASTLDVLALDGPEADLPDVGTSVLSGLDREFLDYLVTGGYLTAINDHARGEIPPATLRVYSDWIRGDFLRLGKSEAYLAETLRGISRRYGSQVTWTALAKELSIEHHQTVADYCHLLERVDAAMIVPALREDRLAAAPKKARKVYFNDPFIFHSLSRYLDPSNMPMSLGTLENLDALPALVEGVVLAQARRVSDVFYIKGNDGEVDCAYLRDGTFWPIEVKWSGRVRPKELKQIQRYPNGLIATRAERQSEMSGTKVLPISLVALRLASGAWRSD